MYAVLRPSPEQEQFDPSAVFGHPESPLLKVAALGDSTITAPGVGGPEEIWITRICLELARSHRVELRSFAAGGSMAHHLIAEQLRPALDFGPDLVVVSVGANDALKGVTPGRFEQNLDILVSELTDAGATVVQSGVGDLGTIPRVYPPLRHLLSRRSLRFNAAHERVAERNGSWVVPQRDGPVDIWDERHMWSDDLFHVSARGHEVWGDLGWKTVARALGIDGD